MLNQDPARLPIGELARRTGTKVQTIRYYESIGLMPEPDRSSGNQRLYSAGHLARLGFIRHSRELGFSLEAIRALLGLTDHPETSCSEADRIATAQLSAVRTRIARLRSLERELERMVSECGQGRVAECRVIEVLADHDRCLSNTHFPDSELPAIR